MSERAPAVGQCGMKREVCILRRCFLLLSGTYILIIVNMCVS